MKISTVKALRFSGLAAIVGSLLLIPGSISLEPPWSTMGILGALLLIYGLVGIYAVQVEQSGLAGLLGFLFLVAGSFTITSSGDIVGIPSWLLGTVFSSLGLILLGIGTLAARKFPRWVAWLWIATVVIGLPAAGIPSLEKPLALAASVLMAAGMTGAGFTLWTTDKGAASREAILQP